MRNPSRMTGRAKRRTKSLQEASRKQSEQPASRDPFAATPEKMLPFVRALAGDTERRLGAALSRPITPPAVAAAARAAQEGYDQTWRYVQSLNVVQHDCRAGCSFCCFLTVETSAPEVFLIAERLRATRTAAQLALLRERLRRTSAAVRGLTPTGRVRAAIPCGLLENGLCSVHDVRPLACRSWNSRDVSACERIMREGGGDLRAVQDQRPFGINAGVHAGLVAAMRGAGLPEDAERRCELNTGLLLALDHPQGIEQWLVGKDILLLARRIVRYKGRFDETENIVRQARRRPISGLRQRSHGPEPALLDPPVLPPDVITGQVDVVPMDWGDVL